jgi:hypothetical protein
MLFLREVFSIVLIFAPAEAQTGHPPDSDVQLMSSTGDYPDGAGPRLPTDEPADVGRCTLTFFAPFECTRRTTRPAAWVRSPDPDLHQTGGEDENNTLGPLIKDALRQITSHLGVEARASSETQSTVMMIGIRG